MPGPLYQFLADDHVRLDALFRRATTKPGVIDRAAYDEFRAGLLRHIAMEEKILIPAAQRLQGGAALPVAAQLRLQHGAIAALLVPSPTVRIIAVLRVVLAAHNPIEEGPGGLYEACERLAAAETESLLAQLGAAPAVPVSAHVDGEKVLQAICRALTRAGFEAEAHALAGDDRA